MARPAGGTPWHACRSGWTPVSFAWRTIARRAICRPSSTRSTFPSHRKCWCSRRRASRPRASTRTTRGRSTSTTRWPSDTFAPAISWNWRRPIPTTVSCSSRSIRPTDSVPRLRVTSRSACSAMRALARSAYQGSSCVRSYPIAPACRSHVPRRFSPIIAARSNNAGADGTSPGRTGTPVTWATRRQPTRRARSTRTQAPT